MITIAVQEKYHNRNTSSDHHAKYNKRVNRYRPPPPFWPEPPDRGADSNAPPHGPESQLYACMHAKLASSRAAYFRALGGCS